MPAIHTRHTYALNIRCVHLHEQVDTLIAHTDTTSEKPFRHNDILHMRTDFMCICRPTNESLFVSSIHRISYFLSYGMAQMLCCNGCRRRWQQCPKFISLSFSTYRMLMEAYSVCSAGCTLYGFKAEPKCETWHATEACFGNGRTRISSYSLSLCSFFFVHFW